MNIHHFRNATMLIEFDQYCILVDPMLGPKGLMPPFTFFRHKPRRNPIVALPSDCEDALKKVTHCLITHRHPDHLDSEGYQFLRNNNIPVLCSQKDAKKMRQKGLNVVQEIEYWKKINFLGGKIEGIPAKHGYGMVSKLMGNVMGFYLEFPEQPSVYLSSDTIYTNSVDKVLTEYQPDIAVLAAGAAQLDIFRPLLMNMNDIIKFIRNAPAKVIANHLEAVNHCPITRKQLKAKLQSEKLLAKVELPKDGEIIQFT